MNTAIIEPIHFEVWKGTLLNQSNQQGGGIKGYRGLPYHYRDPLQQGGGLGSILGGLFRSILPVARRVGESVAKQAAKTAGHVALDALSGRNVGESLEERGKAGAAKLVRRGLKKMNRRKNSYQKLIEEEVTPNSSPRPKKRTMKTQTGEGVGYMKPKARKVMKFIIHKAGQAKKHRKHKIKSSRSLKLTRDRLGQFR